MKFSAKENTTVFQALEQLLHGASRTTMKQYLSNGRVKLNGVVVKNGNAAVPEGAEVVIASQTKERKKRAPFEILWEDSDLIVVSKPAGVLSAGEGITRKPTMHKMVHEYVKESTRGKKGAFVVHRLDKEVTGLIIFAKSEIIQEKLKLAWSEYTKRYLALCESKPPKQSGTIDTWLTEWKQTMHVVPQGEKAVHAVSHYRYIRPEGRYHLLEVTLETGKKNQVRVHLAHIGCHIVGDRKYGANADKNLKVRLLAYSLEVKHPVTARALKWEIQPNGAFLNPDRQRVAKYK